MSEIDVFVADEQSVEPVDTLRWMHLARDVLDAQGVRGDTEVALLFVDEDAIAELNSRFLDHEGPTDVLAFPIDGDDEVHEGGRSSDSLGPMSSDAGPSGPRAAPLGPVGPSRGDDRDADDYDDGFDSGDAPTLLGDVVVCPSVARRNAPSHAGTYDDEIALLVVHGLLHLLGMDHVDDREAQAMERREQELLDQFHRKPVSQ